MYTIMKSALPRQFSFLTVLTLLLCCLTQQAQAKPKNWVAFSAPDGSFTATVPAAPKQTEKGPKTYLWTSTTDPNNSVYLFGYTGLPGLKKAKPADRKKALGAFAGAFLKQMGIKETRRTEVVSKSKIQGLESIGTLKKMPVDVRYLAVTKNERIYVLICIGKTDSGRFFEGFRAK